MRETITTSCGLVLTLPTDEEDARITEAALADPDARELTDEEWEAVQPFVMRGYRPGSGSATYTQSRKAPVMINLDVDILEKLRSSGTDLQTHVNDVMREWLKQNPV